MNVKGAANNVLNAAVLMIALGIIFRPGSRLWAEIDSVRESAREKGLVKTNWGRLLKAGDILGGDAANVRIVVFSDYQCPFCSRDEAMVDSLIAAEVGVRLAQLPLAAVHPHATDAAIASICAFEFGVGAEMHRALFGIDWTEDDLDYTAIGATAGIANLDGFTKCLSSERAHDRLDTDLALAEELGIRGTPTYVTTGGIFRGSTPLSVLTGAIH